MADGFGVVRSASFAACSHAVYGVVGSEGRCRVLGPSSVAEGDEDNSPG